MITVDGIKKTPCKIDGEMCDYNPFVLPSSGIFESNNESNILRSQKNLIHHLNPKS